MTDSFFDVDSQKSKTLLLLPRSFTQVTSFFFSKPTISSLISLMLRSSVFFLTNVNSHMDIYTQDGLEGIYGACG